MKQDFAQCLIIMLTILLFFSPQMSTLAQMSPLAQEPRRNIEEIIQIYSDLRSNLFSTDSRTDQVNYFEKFDSNVKVSLYEKMFIDRQMKPQLSHMHECINFRIMQSDVWKKTIQKSN
jgi:nitrate reductase assembly molybdenum cofactor insertion protein NarJ